MNDPLYVYAAQAADFVKIGISYAPEFRVMQLKTCKRPAATVGIRPTLLAYTPAWNLWAEREAHEQLAADRAEGEWFHLTPAVQAFVDSMSIRPESFVRSAYAQAMS